MARNTNPDARSKSLTREPSGLTLLSGRKPATKTLGLNADGVLDVTKGFENQSGFAYSHMDAPDIWALFEGLKEASKDPNVFVIRGALRGHVAPDKKVYRRKDVSKWRDDAHFEECPRSWVMIDIDKQPLDDIDLINNPKETVKRAVNKFLPDCYQNVSFVWQLSSSAGIGDNNGLLSVHFWFILDRPIGEAELKTVHMLKAPAVDRSLFQTVQVHYIAAPIFENDISDHLPKRIGLVELKSHEVSLPVMPAEVVASAYRTLGTGPTGTVHGFENKLKLIGDGDGLEGFHAVLIAAVSSYVYGKFEYEIDADWLKARLREAIDKAPKRAGRDASDYLSDAYLDQNIDTAVNKFCQAITTPKYPAPTMTPAQARGELKSSLWGAADQHFKALDEWEKVNKPYQDCYSKVYDRLEAAAKKSVEQRGLEYDAIVESKEIRRAVWSDPELGSLEEPGPPPKAIWNLAVGVGLGKTEQAFKLIKYVRDKALALLRADRQADDANKLSDATRIALQRLTRAVLAVPTHKLADEAVERAQKAGLSPGAFRGRLYEIKDTGEHPMCKRASDVRLCIDAGLPVASSMCKSGDAECKFRRVCGYYSQMKLLEGCDVVMVPHASLFHKMPPINSRGLLIIDEQFVFDGVRLRRALPVSELRKNNDKVYVKGDDDKMVVDDDLTTKLYHYREMAADGLIESADGNLSGSSMRKISTNEVVHAIRLEWQTVVHFPVYPGMSRKRLFKALASVSAIKRRRLRVDFWMALLALVKSDRKQKSGWLVRGVDDEGRAVVHVGGRASIKDGWFDGLAICLDATSSPDLVQLYFPKHEVVAPPPIEAIQAKVTVLQTIDQTFSASMCIPDVGLEPEERQRRENRAREVYRFICLRASEFRDQGADGIDVLVVCQQALEEHFVELGLPDNVDIAHFNATRGIDRWGGVRCEITIGRTLPSPVDVEVLAENLTGWAVEKVAVGRWYPRQPAGIDVGSGVGLTVQGEHHPDPMVETVRKQICEAELVQVAGRGRGVNRSADTPLHLDVLTNVCLPVEVGQPIRWEDNAPGRIEEMVGLGLLPEGPAAAAMVYPELWPTANAAKMAARNAQTSRINVKEPDVPSLYTNAPLNGVKPLLNRNSRDLTPFSPNRTGYHLLGPFDALVKAWGIKPLAFGAISRMQFAQARVERPDKRALKFKFLFDPHLIPNPEVWLSERTGLNLTVKHIATPSLQLPQTTDAPLREKSWKARVGGAKQ
jgi:hypothetical protein